MAASGDLEPDPPRAGGDDGQETELWRAFKAEGSFAARERLFSLHYPFARSLAARHFLDRRSGDIEFPELCQLACAGLLEALDQYDPAYGAPFRSYARRRIAGSVLDGIARMSEIREQISLRRRTRKERLRSLAPENPSAPSAADALEALIELATGLAVGFMLEGTTAYVMESDADPKPSAYDALAWKDAIGALMGEVAVLPERERMIIRHHYIGGLSFDQIGDILGLSKGRVSQLHRAAIGVLRVRLQANEAFVLEN